MADVATPQAPAESSPAAAAPETFEVPKSGSPEYAEWRKTGKVPTDKPAASAKEDKSRSTVPDSEPGSKGQEKKSRSAERLEEVLADLKNAGLTPEELKTYKREAKKQEQTEQPKTTPEKTDKPAEKATQEGKPDKDKFDTLDEYYEAVADWKADQKLNQYRQEQRQNAANAEMNQKLSDARERYGAESGATIKTAASALFSDQAVPGAIRAMLNESPVLVDLLFTIGSKPEDLSALIEASKTDPGKAIRKLVLLEQLVQAELKKPAAAKAAQPGGEGDGEGTPERGADGKFLKKGAPEKKDSETPAPPKELGGRGTTPTDPAETAFKDNDFNSFRNSRNRKDLEKRQGR